MAKLVISLFIVTLAAAFFVKLSEAGDVTNGAQGSLNYATFSGTGIVGHVLNNAADGINEADCALLGPDFLNGLLESQTCPDKDFQLTIFESWPTFCKYFNNAEPNIKNCFSTSTINLDGGLPGIFKGYGRLGECCGTVEVSIICKKYKFMVKNI